MLPAADGVRLLSALRRREQRGSKPRCHFLTHGPRELVAERLTALVAPYAQVRPTDRWMPDGFNNTQEAQLHQAAHLLNESLCMQLHGWWLAPASDKAKTPNFDIASTCSVDGKKGLLLVEAKAHDQELLKEAAGRLVSAGANDDRAASHEKIGVAIAEARAGLSAVTHFQCHVHRDLHYQMSNRFAWAWKLATLGIPTILVYLGFVNATEMRDRGRPFSDAADWAALVRTQSATLFAGDVWNRQWSIDGTLFAPLIRALELPLPGDGTSG